MLLQEKEDRGYDRHTTTPAFYQMTNEDRDQLLLMDLPAMNAADQVIAQTTMAVGGKHKFCMPSCITGAKCVKTLYMYGSSS